MIAIAKIFKNKKNTEYADKASIMEKLEALLEEHGAYSASGQQADFSLGEAGNDLRQDKEIVILAIKLNAQSIKYADESLKSDKDVMLEALKSNFHWAKNYFDKYAFENKYFVLEAIKVNPLFYDYTHAVLRKDKEVLICAIDNGRIDAPVEKPKYSFNKHKNDAAFFIDNLPKELIDDVDVAVAIVKYKGYYLDYLPKKMKHNKSVVLAAIKNSAGFNQ